MRKGFYCRNEPSWVTTAFRELSIFGGRLVRWPDLPKASQRFLRLLLLAGLSCSAAQGQFVRDAKSECEQLMNSALPLAKQMLQEHGEFFPFGMALNSNGKVVAVAPYDQREHPTSEDFIRQLKHIFSAQAKAGEFRATALIYDATVQTPTNGVNTDAIAVALDHRDNYSVVVFVPYQLERNQLTLGEMFAQQGAGEVFEHR
jgi:hypothetical protein